MVREFKLVNEKGQSYSLMDIKNYCLLTEPSGLGYSYNTEYEKIGNTFIESLRQMEQGQFNGTINTLHYDNFKALVDFIEGAEKLRLAYKVPYKDGAKEFLKDVKIQIVDKTERLTTGVISEPITFDCLTLWYEEIANIFNMQASEENEIRWDFKWDSKWTDYTSRNINILNKGHENASIEVEIDGHIINPKIELYIEGELYQGLSFTVEIEEYEKFLYGTKDGDFYIRKQKTDGTYEDLFNFDVISEDDFQNKNLSLKIPPNKSCSLRLEADNIIQTAKITMYPYYKCV